MKIVYLDTQDFVRTLPAPHAKDVDHQVLRDILKLRDKGEIALGYSAIHLVEFITQPTDGYELDRVHRGRHIRDICGSNAFPWPFDLKNGITYPNDGYWIFSHGNVPLSLRNIFKQQERAFRERIRREAKFNRRERRKLAKTFSVRNYMVANGLHYEPTRENFGAVPVTQEFLDQRVIDRLMRGEISFAEAERKFLAWFCDPVAFSQIFFEYARMPNLIERYFGPSLDEMSKVIGDYIHHKREIDKLNVKVRKLKSDFGGVAGVADVVKGLKEVEANIGMSSESTKALVEALGKDRVGHFYVYFEHMKRSPESHKRSDFLDLMHMCYGYDVDLFRCDKKMFEIFKDYPPFKNKLVSRFSDLVDRASASQQA